MIKNYAVYVRVSKNLIIKSMDLQEKSMSIQCWHLDLKREIEEDNLKDYITKEIDKSFKQHLEWAKEDKKDKSKNVVIEPLEFKLESFTPILMNQFV